MPLWGGEGGHAGTYAQVWLCAQVTTIKALEEAKGTLKASSRPMPGVEKCEVICCSYYDDKPFHMMGNTTGGVTVIEFYRKCFSTATQVHRGH